MRIGRVMIVKVKDGDLIGLRMKNIVLDAGTLFRCKCMMNCCLVV